MNEGERKKKKEEVEGKEEKGAIRNMFAEWNEVLAVDR